MLEQMWGAVAAFAGGLALLAGLCANMGKIRKWLGKKAADRRFRKELPAKTYTIVTEIKNHDLEQDTAIGNLDQLTSAMINEKLMWAYSYYGVKRHPISPYTKAALDLLFEEYTRRGHNHVPADWQAVMDAAPKEAG